MSLTAAIDGLEEAGRPRSRKGVPTRALMTRVLQLLNLSVRVQASLLLVTLIILRLMDPQPVESLRLRYFDLLQSVQPPSASVDQVVIVDIDEQSLAELGQWPWPRTRVAEMVTALLDSGAAAVGFDMLFAEPDRMSPARFVASTHGLPRQLTQALLAGRDNDQVLAERLTDAPVALGVSATHETDHPYADRRQVNTPVIEVNGDARPHLLAYGSVIRNLDVLEAAAQGRGMVTLNSERDGIVRRVPAVLRSGETLYPTLAVELVRIVTGRENYSLVTNKSGGGVDGLQIGPYDVPTDMNGLVWLRHRQHDPAIYVSATDLFAGDFDRAAIDGKIVLVGTSAVGLRDLRATPVNAAIPGVEIHAQMLNAILGQNFLTRPNYAMGFELSAALLFGILIILTVPRASALASLPIIIAVLAATAGASYYLFSAQSLLIDASFPILCTAALFTILIYGNFSRAEAQRRQVRAAFSQYLAPSLVDRLVNDPAKLELGGEQREMTFLFTDIAGFTAFAENIDPVVLTRTLNAYLDQMCQIVMAHGGTIDKIVGDAVHALFNAPIDQPDHAQRAVTCGLALDSFGKEFAQRMQADGLDFGHTRIGINTGRCVVGNFGGSQRFDYTAHGDAINTAARLEAANKHLGTTICVAGTTADQCRDVLFRPIGSLLLQGRRRGLDTFEPIPASEGKSQQIHDYIAAFASLNAAAPEALKAFRDLVERYPQDPLAALHFRRLSDGQAGIEFRVEK